MEDMQHTTYYTERKLLFELIHAERCVWEVGC
jgi:hypothetical protein